jgi:DHA1 family quinolone resistance protein-like MFS transporter
MNKMIRVLMFSDLLIMSGFGLIAPILAIYFKESVQGGSIFAAGLATTIYFVTKSIIQLPFSRYVDAHDHTANFLFWGTILVSITPFIYFFAKDMNTIYFAQVVLGIGNGVACSCWLGLWSSHLDKHHESFEWSLYSTTTNTGAAVAALIGAFITQKFGFRMAFLFVGGLSILGNILLLQVVEDKKKVTKAIHHHYHVHRKLAVTHAR